MFAKKIKFNFLKNSKLKCEKKKFQFLEYKI